MMSKVFVFLSVVVLGSVVAAEESSDDAGNVKLLMKLVTECGRKDDFGICLKMRALTFMDKLVRLKDPVAVTDYVKLVRDPKAKDEEKSISETELEATLPRSLDEKDSRLDEMLWEKVAALFGTRTVQLSVPKTIFEGRAGDKGGKGGKKGMGGMMMMAGMMMAMMFKLALAKIFLIAGKALMIAKISLVISLIMILKKWASGGGHHSEVIYASDHGGHRRSGPDDTFLSYAQELAYSAQKPLLA